MRIPDVRALFPGTERGPYLDVAVRCLLGTPVREAIEGHLDVRMRVGGEKQALHATVERARSGFARLIGAEADEIAVVKNVSEGLNAFANSLEWSSGDNVVVCPELEHPNNVFLWYNLRRRYGVEVREVESPDRETVPVEAMVAAMDSSTRIVTVPTITFSPGFLTDVDALVAGARAHDVLTLVDAAQSIGAVRTDVRALGVDALTVATQKSLLALYGTGFLYVRRSVAEGLVPGSLARYGVDLGPDAHETAVARGDLRFGRSARRFDLGNYNYLGATAAAAALELIAEIGIDRIEAHVRRLAARLAHGLCDLGLPVAGGRDDARRAHIVAVGDSGGGRHYTADDPAMNELHAHLTAGGVTLSIRRGVLRFSLGVYNDESDVDRVLELTREWTRTR